MGAAGAAIGDDDRRLLVAHYQFYRSLDTGSRVPVTAAQRHFIAVCRGTASPETDHERAYSRFKQVVAAAGVSEEAVVASGFVWLLPGSHGEGIDAGEVVDVPVRPCAGCGRPRRSPLRFPSPSALGGGRPLPRRSPRRRRA